MEFDQKKNYLSKHNIQYFLMYGAKNLCKIALKCSFSNVKTNLRQY